MKWTLVVVTLSGLIAVTSAGSASLSKPAPKPTKSSAKNDITLSEKDIEFLAQVEKQFKEHGNLVTFKIQTDNSTSGGKSNKRTIESDLGYGYQNGGGEYHFSQPRFMIYPYSQHDIPPLHSSENVHIQPSNGYEIRETGNAYLAPQIHQQYIYSQVPPQAQYVPDYSQPQRVVPIIYLRIPGPPAYAQHLQALLQAYIASRTQQYIQPQQPSYDYRIGQSQQQYVAPQVQYQQPQQVQYVDTPVQQQYVPEYQQQQIQVPEYQQQQQQQLVQYESAPVEYESPPVQYQETPNAHVSPNEAVPQVGAGDNAYRQQEIQQEAQPTYEQEPQTNAAPLYQAQGEEPPISENNPRKTHTQVIFSPNIETPSSQIQGFRTQSQLFQPSGHSYQSQNQEFAHQQMYYVQGGQGQGLHSQGQAVEYIPQTQVSSVQENDGVEHRGHEKAPFNYHAHKQESQTAKRNAPFTTEQFKKYSKLIAKLKHGRVQ